ncbi:hypothetical protein ACKKBG_A09155 [Auxenochlorella protothecoides x Auxenochlorella symbiontica]
MTHQVAARASMRLKSSVTTDRKEFEDSAEVPPPVIQNPSLKTFQLDEDAEVNGESKAIVLNSAVTRGVSSLTPAGPFNTSDSIALPPPPSSVDPFTIPPVLACPCTWARDDFMCNCTVISAFYGETVACHIWDSARTFTSNPVWDHYGYTSTYTKIDFIYQSGDTVKAQAQILNDGKEVGPPSEIVQLSAFLASPPSPPPSSPSP